MADFEKIFKENQEFVFKYLMKMTRDQSLAEELTQETFFRAYINILSLRNEDKILSWLCQIAKNTYFAWYNEQKRRDALDAFEDVSDDENVEEKMVQMELSQKALECLDNLDEPYKEVFKLSVFGGLSLKDISLAFGKSESWARVTFYRAKQKILENMR